MVEGGLRTQPTRKRMATIYQLTSVNPHIVSVEDAALEIPDQLTRIYFSEVPMDVKADEFLGCISQRGHVKPAFSSSCLFQISLCAHDQC